VIFKMLGGRIAKRQDPALSTEFDALLAQSDMRKETIVPRWRSQSHRS
jgi:hypothetical protein